MQHFRDPDRGTLVVTRHLASGRSFDIVEATRDDDPTPRVARAPRYGTGTDVERKERLDAARREVAALDSRCDALPRNAELWLVDGVEPVVVYDRIEGRRLDAFVAAESPEGLPTERILPLAADILAALHDLHERGFVHRCLAPEHVLVTPQGRAVVIGLGNCSLRNGPACAAKETTDEVYSAPEILSETSGRLSNPRADVFAFGMLLAFMATGQRPTGNPAGPLTRTAYHRLVEGDRGIALIVARCIQPLQKNRVGVARLREVLQPGRLPDERTEGFGALALLMPWGAADGVGLPVGHLSPGPLVDRPSAKPTPSDPTPPTQAQPTPAHPTPAPPAQDRPTQASRTSDPHSPRGRVVAVALSVLILAIAAWVTIRSLTG